MQKENKKKKRSQSVQQWASYAMHIIHINSKMAKGWKQERDCNWLKKVKIIITGIFPYAQKEMTKKEELYMLQKKRGKYRLTSILWIENELNLITIECKGVAKRVREIDIWIFMMWTDLQKNFFLLAFQYFIGIMNSST